METFRFVLETGDRNVGDVYLPAGARGKLPVVVYCHGWGGNRTLGASTQAVLRRCLDVPMALVAFDFYGCGETGGDYGEMSYGRWTANLGGVVDWVAAQEWADAAKIGCFSISSGTTPALRLAETSAQLAFVVSVATCLGLFINMPNGPGKVLVDNWDILVGGGTATIFGTPFGLDFFQDFIGKAPVYDLQSVKCPVFFLQGKLDNPWRRADAWIGYEVMKRHGLPVKHLELEHGGHGLDEVPDECAEQVVRWLREITIIA